MPLRAGILRSIRFCIERTSLAQFACRTQTSSVYEDPKFIESYYANIVRPLEEDLVHGANWSWDEVDWRKPRELNDFGITKVITAQPTRKVDHRERVQHQTSLPPLEEEPDGAALRGESNPRSQGHGPCERVIDGVAKVLAEVDV